MTTVAQPDHESDLLAIISSQQAAERQNYLRRYSRPQDNTGSAPKPQRNTQQAGKYKQALRTSEIPNL